MELAPFSRTIPTYNISYPQLKAFVFHIKIPGWRELRWPRTDFMNTFTQIKTGTCKAKLWQPGVFESFLWLPGLGRPDARMLCGHLWMRSLRQVSGPGQGWRCVKNHLQGGNTNPGLLVKQAYMFSWWAPMGSWVVNELQDCLLAGCSWEGSGDLSGLGAHFLPQYCGYFH